MPERTANVCEIVQFITTGGEHYLRSWIFQHEWRRLHDLLLRGTVNQDKLLGGLTINKKCCNIVLVVKNVEVLNTEFGV